jgi:hypothetical protein
MDCVVLVFHTSLEHLCVAPPTEIHFAEDCLVAILASGVSFGVKHSDWVLSICWQRLACETWDMRIVDPSMIMRTIDLSMT